MSTARDILASGLVIVLVGTWTGCGDDGKPGADAGDIDAAIDAGPLPSLPVQAPFDVPMDPLAGSGVESCAVYQAQRCEAGVQQQCAVYDVGAAAFDPAPDPLLHRVLLYERWYDLYHQPDGQTADRVFAGETLAGTPEATWGDPGHFARWAGAGDAAIWTGKALAAYALRYVETGTEADYQRMEDKVRRLLTMFDVTGIPGYLARHHFLLMDPWAPQTDQHIFRHDAASLDHRDYVFDPTGIPDLPAVYTDGYDDGQTVHHGTPMWHGSPSIDQYSGPMTAFPMVYGLLRDPALQQRITRHITCYLKRLERIEVINLQQNPDVLEAVLNYFAGANLQLDPGDLDFTQLDTVVLYVTRQPNSLNTDDFDRTCPDEIHLTPWRVLDGTETSFILDLFELATDLGGRDTLRARGIDHFYVVSARGGDAMHLMHLAAMAYYFTGEDRYREFLYRELIDNLGAVDVAHTMGAMVYPRWCRSFFGTHITITPFWDLLQLLGDSPLKSEMQQVMEAEMWQRNIWNLGHPSMDLMYASTVPDAIATSKAEAVSRALQSIAEFGGNGGVVDDPRRTYNLDRQWMLQNLPAGISTICPTEAERALCEDGIEVFGVHIAGEDITGDCTGAAGECPVGDGCAEAMTDQPMPVGYRVWEDYLWQRNPFKIGQSNASEGLKQSPGMDFIEAFWLARVYGYLDTGRSTVLAWEDIGACP